MARQPGVHDLAGYGLALAAVALALAAGLALARLATPAPFAFSLFLAAVTVSAWYGGLGPGLAATLVGALAVAYFFVSPRYSLAVTTIGAVVDLLVFTLVALLISSVNASLRRARAQAEAAARVRDEVLAAVSHDLRNPLASLRMTVDLLRLQVGAPGGATGPEVAEALADLEATTARMNGLVGELLDAAQLRAGQQVALDRRPTDLAALVERVVGVHRRTSPRHDLRLVVADGPLVGDLDAGRLERVVENLVGNAVKYSPDGGEVVVRLGRERGADGEWAVLEVRDRGVGVPDADLARLFEPFARGANAVGRFPGAGLGLAVARWVVEQHGGSITVASREGEGSAFRARLPLRARPVGEPRAEAPRAPADRVG
jgi:signal transduction histidine kinase